MKAGIHIALVGNPNSGKSSLFNALTGLHQKVGNFPGVTVDKKTGDLPVGPHETTLIDLPGTYSFYPKREDEWVAYRVLMGVDEHLKSYVPDRLGHDFRYSVDSSKITLLGFECSIDLENGLRELIDWYLENPDWWTLRGDLT
jgi:energy-coupling factor transporter ATP-binding protein EcfA2